MQRKGLLLTLCFACAAGLLAWWLWIGSRTREVSLGKFDPGTIYESLAVSPDSRRAAYGVQRGDKHLHGAPACHHGWRSLLGVESVQGRPASLDVDICRGCASFEPVLADTYAADTVATD